MASCSSSTNGLMKNQSQVLLGDQPNQTKSFTTPKTTFGLKKPIYHSFHSSWFKKWPWLHYHQLKDKAYCFTHFKASIMGIFSICAYSRSEDAFVHHVYTNWKHASGDKIKGGFCLQEWLDFHRHSQSILAQSHRDIAEMMPNDHETQKAVSHAYLRKVLQNVVLLARQGLPFRCNWVPADKEGKAGIEMSSNFHHLLHLRTQEDQNI